VPRHADDVKGQAASGSNREGESTEAARTGGAARSSVEGPVMELERRGCVVRPWPLANRKREAPMGEAKPFEQRPNIGCRVTREVHVRIWERPEVRVLWATRHEDAFPPPRLRGRCWIRKQSSSEQGGRRSFVTSEMSLTTSGSIGSSPNPFSRPATMMNGCGEAGDSNPGADGYRFFESQRPVGAMRARTIRLPTDRHAESSPRA
jgi:hypothetical protein